MKEVKPTPPGYVRWAAQTLEDGGYETWAVGGAIRNTLLGLPSGDWDLATRAPPGVVRRLFPRTVPVGIEHGTVGVLTRQGTLLEVTTFRKDVETFGRKASVEFAQTLAEDLSRRDFTVNAVAWHPLTGEFYDPFGGRVDLEAGLLRTVGVPQDRFREDYLRVLRGLRFSGRFRFRIEAETWRALRAATERLDLLSPERIREELMKVLSSDPAPSRSLSLYHLSGALRALYPEVAAVHGFRREPGGDDWWVHTLLLTDALPQRHVLLRLAAFFGAVGVPEEPGVTLEDRPKDDEARAAMGMGEERVAAAMFRLRFSNQEIRTVTELVKAGLEPPLNCYDPAAQRRWLHDADPEYLPSLIRVWMAKARLDRQRVGRDPEPLLALVRGLRKEARSGSPLRSSDLQLDGRDLISLGLKPGPIFREILSTMMQRVLEDPQLNQREILRRMVVEMLGEGGKEGG